MQEEFIDSRNYENVADNYGKVGGEGDRIEDLSTDYEGETNDIDGPMTQDPEEQDDVILSEAAAPISYSSNNIQSSSSPSSSSSLTTASTSVSASQEGISTSGSNAPAVSVSSDSRSELVIKNRAGVGNDPPYRSNFSVCLRQYYKLGCI